MNIRGLAVAFGTVLAALTLTACGNSGDTVATTADEPTGSSPSQGPSQSPAEPLPPCASVWVKGADLPRDYQGCSKAGKNVEAHHIGCSSGQRVYVHAHRFWAIRGHAISEAEKGFQHSRAFKDMWAGCRG